MVHEEEEENKPRITPEEYLQKRKSSIRKKSWWAIGIGGFIVAAHLILFAIVIGEDPAESIVTWSDLFRSIYFILALFALVAGFFGIREANKLRFEDLIPSREAIEFSEKMEFIKPHFSYILVGSIVAVFIAELVVDSNFPTPPPGVSTISILKAGLIKNLVYQNGEWWRLFTGATVHAGFLHIMFNGYALYGFGNLIEYLSNRAHLAIVMVIAMVGGNLASLLFWPGMNSVGASGGIMGLIGFLAVYGLRRRAHLMPGFFKAMLKNIGFIAAFGVIGYQIFDNFAHMGGLLIGAAYGYYQVPREPRTDARETGTLTNAFGYAALGIFVATSVLSILLISGIISLG